VTASQGPEAQDIDLLEPAREALMAQKALSYVGDYVFLTLQRPVHQNF
jgi:hypothetical protein